MLLASGSAAWHFVHAVQAWLGWRLWAVNDPSLADSFWLSMEIELLYVTLCLTAAAIIWRLTRERAAIAPLI